MTLVYSGRQRLYATGRRQRCSCGRLLYTTNAIDTSEKIRSVLWKTGQRNQGEQQRHRDADDIFAADVELAAKIRQFRKEPLGGNPYSTYALTNSTQRRQNHDQRGIVFQALPLRIPSQSEIHSAYTSMPLSRQNVRFNPWGLLLEFLDDPRTALNTGSDVSSRGKALLATIVRLGKVTLDNILMQRPLLARYVQGFKVFTLTPQDNATNDDIPLTTSQHAALSQIQFPRFIAEKYAKQVSATTLQDEDCSSVARRAQWDRSWLSANLAILELQTTFLKHRALFGKRLDMAQQSRLLTSSAFEHAPGLVLNIIMSWNDDYKKILTPYMIHRLCTKYFSDPDTIREAIVQAWQMYDWLAYHGHTSHMMAPSAGDTYAVSVKLFRSLESFDNWAEAERYFNRVQRSWANPSDAQTQRLLASDNILVERYMSLVLQLRGHWRPKPRDSQDEQPLDECD